MAQVNQIMAEMTRFLEVSICRQEFGLEPAHLAGGCAAAFDGLAADNPTYREIASEPVSVICVFQ
jgi:hypothetical protein